MYQWQKKSTDKLTTSLLPASQKEDANLQSTAPVQPSQTLQQMGNDAAQAGVKGLWKIGISMLGRHQTTPPVNLNGAGSSLSSASKRK